MGTLVSALTIIAVISVAAVAVVAVQAAEACRYRIIVRSQLTCDLERAHQAAALAAARRHQERMETNLDALHQPTASALDLPPEERNPS